MTDDRPMSESPTDGAKRLVRIMARRRRATSEPNLFTVFCREGGGEAEFKPALDYALLHGWISRRSDGLLTGPRQEGLRAASL